YKPCTTSAQPPYETQMLSGTEARPYSGPWYVSIQYEEGRFVAL
ncbi:unnamed protein product, partial [Rotaria sordida]